MGAALFHSAGDFPAWCPGGAANGGTCAHFGANQYESMNNKMQHKRGVWVRNKREREKKKEKKRERERERERKKERERERGNQKIK
jgi:hypothetical protein